MKLPGLILAMIVLLAGCATAPKPAVHLQLIEPPGGTGSIDITNPSKPKGVIEFRDGGLAWRFRIVETNLDDALALAVEIANRYPHPVVVPWDHVTLVGPDGVAHRVVHRAIRMARTDASFPPSELEDAERREDRRAPPTWLYRGHRGPGTLAAD